MTRTVASTSSPVAGSSVTVVTSPVSSFTVLVVNASPIGFSTDLKVTLVVGSVRTGAAKL